MENWKKIKGFENYEVSNFGRVKRNECTIVYSNGQVTKYKLKYLKLENSKGYKRVTLCVNNKPKRFLVHRLVAEYFKPNTENKPCVNHIDGQSWNNHAINLEWCTHSENEIHSYKVLGKKTNGIKSRKIPLNEIQKIKSMHIYGVTQREISKMYNVSQSIISLIINNKTYQKWI
jgi:hypothetical protein